MRKKNGDAMKKNRRFFISELRSGEYKKGTIKSDERGRPIFDTDADKDGFCACAIMAHIFGTVGEKVSPSIAAKALGISSNQCGYIQREINDTNLTFPQMADRIEAEVFGAKVKS